MEQALTGAVTYTYTPAQIEIFSQSDYKYFIIPKGRRAAMTRGAELAFIEWALEGITPLLWVDTINGNIDRYFERYFIPDLNKWGKQIKWHWESQKKILKINNSLIDFRSADSPEAIEGFGYKVIFLNEAGIILKDSYLYKHAILPMLLDFPDARLIAAGTPKGKLLRNGDKHTFFSLYEKSKAGQARYRSRTVTSYENPFIATQEIDELILGMTEAEAQQEIYGQFVDYSGNRPFLHQFKPEKHVSPLAVFQPQRQIAISLDFNIDPFAVNFSHIWRDNRWHWHTFDEMEIRNGSVPEMITRIRGKYGAWLHSAVMTGDAMGKMGQISQRDNASLYKQLLTGLGMHPSQLKVSGNPTHENSRADCNFVFLHLDDLKIHPDCKWYINDLQNVQVDAYGEIIKRNRADVNQRSDQLDCGRYAVHNLLREFIKQVQHQQKNKLYLPIPA